VQPEVGDAEPIAGAATAKIAIAAPMIAFTT
jgi:hypothetical protein